MTQDTAVRTQISALLFTMTNAVLFGAGLIAVLMLDLSAQATGIGIAVVTAFSLIVAAPFSWLIAPRLRARYWRKPQAVPEPTRAS
jgi:membrane glycosyltransferase